MAGWTSINCEGIDNEMRDDDMYVVSPGEQTFSKAGEIAHRVSVKVIFCRSVRFFQFQGIFEI